MRPNFTCMSSVRCPLIGSSRWEFLGRHLGTPLWVFPDHTLKYNCATCAINSNSAISDAPHISRYYCMIPMSQKSFL